jgi:polysaccharide deacetylase family protein (PEP-CTERM system associated)
MKNVFTVDLEDWFCSHNLKSVIRYESWDQLESRVEQNATALLHLLDRNKTKATFFVLGWIASRFPGLVQIIQKEGHEIASHGYAHQQITSQTPEEFERDIIASVDVLKNITGEHPKGYRAPAFSITSHTQWALPILKTHGIQYDSSIYPFSLHPDYGNAAVPLSQHDHDGLTEIPLSCATIGKFRIPCSGGAYLRFYPLSVFTLLAKRVRKQGRPLIFYIHPWEIDRNPPRISLPFTKSLRHYYNNRSTLHKVEVLLKEFEFTSFQNFMSV